MGTFKYDSFTDLSQVFDLRKGELTPSVSKARVTLFTSTVLKSRFLQSKFVDIKALLPEAKKPFLIVSAKKAKPVAIETAPVVQPVVAETMTVAVTNEEPKEEAKKARTTLRLKTKVDVPVLTTITRNSSTQDLAAAFKSEMAIMEKKAAKAPSQDKSILEDAFTRRRRHPLSHKPWSELLAEVESPKKQKHNIDLATAFKAEMKAFMAEQEKMGVSDAIVSPTLKFKTAAEHKVVSSKPQASVHHRRPSMAA
jgi:hypothetical protein